LLGTLLVPSETAVGAGLGAQVDPQDFLSSGGSHSCVIASAGGVACWGGNDQGQLGDGTFTSRNSPALVTGLTTGVRSVSAGFAHTCVVMDSGGVKCWGGNQFGALGNGTTTKSALPVDVSGLASGVVAVSAGGNHTCALLDSGGVQCWGWNSSGQLGVTGGNRTTPIAVPGARSGIRAIAAGFESMCALTTGGGVRCWGDNSSGQLGNDSTADSTDPMSVVGLGSGVQAISAGYHHVCALLATGGVKCWGVAGWGQLGSGGSVGSHSELPLQVYGLTSGVVAVSAGHSQTCALLNDGSARCWGLNSGGEVGDGTTELRSRPTQVQGLNLATVSISAGGTFEQFFGCARSSDGIQCWGENQVGQIGRPAPSGSLVPVHVDLAPALLSFLSQPTVARVGAPFSVQPKVQVQDILGNLTFSAVSKTTITLSASGGPGTLTCDGGLSKTADLGVAEFTGCQLSAQGTYIVRATSGSLAPAESPVGVVSPRAFVPLIATDAPSLAASAAYLGSGRFQVSWPAIEPGQVVCGRIEKFRGGARVFYGFRSPNDGCDFGMPTTLYPTGFVYDANFGYPPADIKDIQAGDVYCFHVSRQAQSGLDGTVVMDPPACATITAP
jgi:alpha-tubulin suppressor-like RCC1 family protein